MWGGYGGGKFKANDQVKEGDKTIKLWFPEGDKTEVEYESFAKATDIKRATIYAMCIDAERNGHVTFDIAFHGLKRKTGAEGWEISRVKGPTSIHQVLMLLDTMCASKLVM